MTSKQRAEAERLRDQKFPELDGQDRSDERYGFMVGYEAALANDPLRVELQKIIENGLVSDIDDDGTVVFKMFAEAGEMIERLLKAL